MDPQSISTDSSKSPIERSEGLNIQESGGEIQGRTVKKAGKTATFKKAAAELGATIKERAFRSVSEVRKRIAASRVGKRIATSKVGKRIAESRVGRFVSSVMELQPRWKRKYRPQGDRAETNERNLKAYLEDPTKEGELVMAAKAGHPEANYRCYVLFNEKDKKTALAYLVKAVEYGHTKAMIEYAKDMEKVRSKDSKKYLRKAADQGDKEAQYLFWERFHSDEKETKASKDYLQKSADAGYGPACEKLFENRRDALLLLENAILWYRKEADPSGGDVIGAEAKAKSCEETAAQLIKQAGKVREAVENYREAAKLREWVKEHSITETSRVDETEPKVDEKNLKLQDVINKLRGIENRKKAERSVESSETKRREQQERIEQELRTRVPEELLAKYTAIKDLDPINAMKFMKQAVYKGYPEAIITWYEKLKSDEEKGHARPGISKEFLLKLVEKFEQPKIWFKFWEEFHDDPSAEGLANNYLFKCVDTGYGPALSFHAAKLEEAANKSDDEKEKLGLLRAAGENYYKAYQKADTKDEAERLLSKCLDIQYGPAYVVWAEKLELVSKSAQDQEQRKDLLKDASLYYGKACEWYRESGNNAEATKCEEKKTAIDAQLSSLSPPS